MTAALAIVLMAPALPDMPTPKPEAIVAVRAPVRHPEPFWDRTVKVEAAALALTAGADMAQTCHFLANGQREMFLPTQHCGIAVAMMGAQDLGSLGLAWVLNRTGHHRMAKVPMALMSGAHVRAIVYSKQHGAL